MNEPRVQPAAAARRTPAGWIDRGAARRRDLLLIDHANCEKKAASTALALMFAYAEDLELADKLSRLAREELRHYEQVAKLIRTLQHRAAAPRARPLCGAAAPAGRAGRAAARARSDDLRRLHRGALLRALRRAGAGDRRRRSASCSRGLHAAEARHGRMYLDLARARRGAQRHRCRRAHPGSSPSSRRELITAPRRAVPLPFRRAAIARQRRQQFVALLDPSAARCPASCQSPSTMRVQARPSTLEAVNGRAVRMSVQQRRQTPAVAQCRRDAVGVDVGDGVVQRRPCAPGCRCARRRPAPGAARPTGPGIRRCQPGIPHRGAQALIGAIVRAQRIAVHHQHRLAVQGQDQRIRQQRGPGQRAESRRPAGNPGCRASRNTARRPR